MQRPGRGFRPGRSFGVIRELTAELPLIAGYG